MTAHRRADHLRADCARCVGLCCVAPAFAASADFAIDKPPGMPCPNLRADFRCGIHARLMDEGFRGCAAYDCFGAGQRVTQAVFPGRDWRTTPALAGQMFDVFQVLRGLHELRWHLTEAMRMPAAAPLRADLRSLLDEIEERCEADADALAGVDVTVYGRRASALLVRTSALVRGAPAGRELAGCELVGRNLRRQDLRRALLCSALLIGADLSGADLSGADLRGADLRGADLSGADLTGCIFVTHSQLQSARGDAATRLPAGVARPTHWADTPATTAAGPP